MGKGDRKTRQGKIWRGTFGKTRPRNKKNNPSTTETTEKEEKKS